MSAGGRASAAQSPQLQDCSLAGFGGRVYPHVARGEHYRARDRFHVILASELWWFDNKQVHEARNDSVSERIHLIFEFELRESKAREAP